MRSYALIASIFHADSDIVQQGMARILSIVRCRLKDEGGGNLRFFKPPPDLTRGETPLGPPFYISLLPCYSRVR